MGSLVAFAPTIRSPGHYSAEGYFSIFSGMRGLCQHCREKPLHRYLAEYDSSYNHRIALGFHGEKRAGLAVRGAEGKRLTYGQPNSTVLWDTGRMLPQVAAKERSAKLIDCIHKLFNRALVP